MGEGMDVLVGWVEILMYVYMCIRCMSTSHSNQLSGDIINGVANMSSSFSIGISQLEGKWICSPPLGTFTC